MTVPYQCLVIKNDITLKKTKTNSLALVCERDNLQPLAKSHVTVCVSI